MGREIRNADESRRWQQDAGTWEVIRPGPGVEKGTAHAGDAVGQLPRDSADPSWAVRKGSRAVIGCPSVSVRFTGWCSSTGT
jgi:hypothetical protein